MLKSIVEVPNVDNNYIYSVNGITLMIARRPDNQFQWMIFDDGGWIADGIQPDFGHAYSVGINAHDDALAGIN